MVRKSIYVDVKIEVLKWLIESSGWNEEEIAKRLNTNLQNIQKILKDQKKLTLKQIQVLSKAFKRPVAAFLLSKPLPEKPKPKDYRLLPNKLNKFDKKTLLILRKARELQELCYELSTNIKYDTKIKIKRVKISDNPRDIANKYRKIFNLDINKQVKFKTPYEFFNHLRDKLEDTNIYVFQFSMPVDDARGFVFVDEYPFIIVVNSKDSIEARLFTLMHEFAHILLGETVIDLPDIRTFHKDKVESWCNQFSASFLFPEDVAKEIFSSYNTEMLTSKEILEKISRKFKISKSMILLNLLKLNFITKEKYEYIMELFKKSGIKEKKGSGFKIEQRVLSEKGNKFVSLVANNYDKEFITYNDALNYLSIKTKHFEKVLSKAKK